MKNFFTYFTDNANLTLVAFDALDLFEGESIEELGQFLNRYKSEYRFGFVSYDFLNQNSLSKNIDAIGFPKTGFFIPKYVVEINAAGKKRYLKGQEDDYSLKRLNHFLASERLENKNRIKLNSRYTKAEYISTIENLQSEMKAEEVGVVVFCQDFYAAQQDIDPSATYFHLNQKSKAPFSCFLQWNERYLLSASPERFIKKEGNKLITQPIKGTAKRGKTKVEDEELKSKLLLSAKEQEENTLVVEGIKKELRQIAKKDTVHVEAFSKVYTFETVHQLISTLSAEIAPDTAFTDILKALFPMGSMIGVPKEKAIEIISRYERFNRGLYSGTVGYIKPNGNFDFNVVIRSIIYDKSSNNIICPVGGGITLQSSPEDEYEECLIKVKALQEVLNNE